MEETRTWVTKIKRISINSEHSYSFFFIMLSRSFPRHFSSSALQSIIGKGVFCFGCGFFVDLLDFMYPAYTLCLITEGIQVCQTYFKRKKNIKRHMVFEFVETSCLFIASLKPACLVFFVYNLQAKVGI